MSGLVFTLIALLLSLAGSLVVWLRHRKPTSLDYGIVEFQREMRALSPDPPWRTPSRNEPPVS